MRPDRDAILRALENVIDPELRKPVTELDMVRDVLVEDDGSVSVTIALTVAGCPLRDSFQEQVSRHVGEVPGVTSVRLGFDVMSPEQKAALVSRLRGGHSADRTISLSPTTRVLAVASGKGGVGKSTLTANLAYALSALGEQVGVLDGDIYGHSIPHMLGIHQKPIAVDEMIVPPVRGDLKLMSIGFFLEENAPIMWRGPMLHKALEQFLSDVHWGELDTLLVDMPPGTGDVAMSLGQLLPRAEALVVTTPQPAAQQVAVRAAQMARKTGMRLVGAVENMSYLAGSGEELFGSGGGQALADEMGIPSLPVFRSTRSCARLRTRDLRSPSCTRRGRHRRDRRARGLRRRVPRGHDPEGADGSLGGGRGRLLRPRPHADLAFELARARGDVLAARAHREASRRPGRARAARLHEPPARARRRWGGQRTGLRPLLKGPLRRRAPRDRRRGVADRAPAARLRGGSRPRGLAPGSRRACVHRVGGAAGGRRDDRAASSDSTARSPRCAEIEDGVYTGRLERRLYGAGEACRSRGARERPGLRSHALDRVLRLAHRPRLPRSRRAPRCGEPGSRPSDASSEERGWPVLWFKRRLGKQ